ncbi:hypothetical protein T484DRAFT_1989674 [Baffinella frigidus]|nr:hypothetical protein T484DRAFT_1989674 [Cryptophyta sp. CCMP2293]
MHCPHGGQVSAGPRERSCDGLAHLTCVRSETRGGTCCPRAGFECSQHRRTPRLSGRTG